jgi:large subunit ribosomal protein L23
MLSKEITDKEKRLILEDGWTVLINDTQYEDVILDELRFKPMNKGDKVVLTKKLPEEWKFKRPALCLHIRQTTVDMFVDGQRVYDYGHERLKNNYTIGSGIQIIDFSNDYKGKELKIVLEVSEKYAFSKMDEMWISEWSDSYRLILAENRLAFFLGAFLVVFGIVVTTILVFVVAKSSNKTEIKLAIEKLFDVQVESVNTVNCRGKLKRMGRNEGFTPAYKKAIVQLKADSKTIEFFDSLS